MFSTNNGFKLNGKTKGLSLSMGSFMGNSELVVFNSKSTNKGPLWKFPLGNGAVAWIISNLEKIKNAPGGSRKSLIHQEWDFNEKKFKNKKSLTIGKDDNKSIYFGVQGMSITDFEMFIMDMFGYDQSPENLTQEEKGILVASDLIDCFRNLRLTFEALSKDTVSVNKQKEKWQNKGNQGYNSNATKTNDNIPF
jgi:hypothetical protein